MLGGGDLKLLISAGLFLGLRKEIIVVGMSSIVMLLEIMLIKIFLKKKYDGLYPFGPSISFSIMLVYLLGNSQYHLF